MSKILEFFRIGRITSGYQSISNLPLSIGFNCTHITCIRAFSSYKRTSTRVLNNASAHSARWIQRQLNDRYVMKAQMENYRSRAAYKLIQLDDRYLFLRKNQCVVDLGCYPGGWSQVALNRCLVGAPDSTSRVIGVDKHRMDELPNHSFILGNIGSSEILASLQQSLTEAKVDVVLSDLAPACTGLKQDDHLLSTELSLQAAELSEEILRLGGWLILKVFMGGQLSNLKIYLQSRFERVRSAKPKACRAESPEIYLVCEKFIGRTSIASEVQIKGGFTTREG
ncbi:ribosomal Rna methyltransferase (FtsJ) family protein [Cardiosporidium cionae]|uniref:rRNA methyltransferase 2, mitochondrial n=1 Tax=Cardiosporidium cionae TaxID=476202 RepID=A0ABQ7JC11_9APIC|nr:ribosomal Rna methyltransferase (FtsJ) family protein [Cardiosporidium cionae]|eukprot:KAF8821540.1 ribosomal Rna methyltransferase (FtsJ) family protein [Cardiosporidium cionae]